MMTGKSAITSANGPGFRAWRPRLGWTGGIIWSGCLASGAQLRRLVSPARPASIYATLISDASGIYDPRIYDDPLLLAEKAPYRSAVVLLAHPTGASSTKQTRRAAPAPAGRLVQASEEGGTAPKCPGAECHPPCLCRIRAPWRAHQVLLALRDQSFQLPRRWALAR
jgi:hypothetical protein